MAAAANVRGRRIQGAWVELDPVLAQEMLEALSINMVHSNLDLIFEPGLAVVVARAIDVAILEFAIGPGATLTLRQGIQRVVLLIILRLVLAPVHRVLDAFIALAVLALLRRLALAFRFDASYLFVYRGVRVRPFVFVSILRGRLRCCRVADLVVIDG